MFYFCYSAMEFQLCANYADKGLEYIMILGKAS